MSFREKSGKGKSPKQLGAHPLKVLVCTFKRWQIVRMKNSGELSHCVSRILLRYHSNETLLIAVFFVTIFENNSTKIREGAA